MVVSGSLLSGGSVLVPQLLELTPLQFSGAFLELAILFFILAFLAAVVGASGVAGVSLTIAKWFVIIFLALAVISILL